MEKNIKNIREDFKSKGIFYTPPELAETLKSYVDFTPKSIYDPTCGQGNLLAVFDDDIPKYGQEIDPEELRKAKERIKNFTGHCGNTLKQDCFDNMTFDLIVANPPFSIKWEPLEDDPRFIQAGVVPSAGKADYAFMLHILSHLARPGKAVVLEFPGVLYRGQREGKIRQWMVERNLIERVVHIPGNTFVDTSIATCIIVFNKGKNTTDIIFEDREARKERTVPLEEVKENGYTLSVNTYIQQEPEQKETVDIEAVNEELSRAALEQVKEDIRMRQLMSEIDGKPDPTRRIVANVLRCMADVLTGSFGESEG